MSLGEIAAWIVIALACMAGNLAGGYWLGRDVFGHNSDTPFRTRLLAHGAATLAIVLLLLIAVLAPKA